MIHLPTKRLTVLACAALLSGCGSPNFKPKLATAVAVQPALPAPAMQDRTQAVRPSFIGPGDQLNFQVFGMENFDRVIRVDGDGLINIPLIGNVDTTGQTVAQVREQIQGRLGQRYLQNPQVSLILTEQVSQRFVIDGGVTTPGIYPVTGNQSLMQSVAQAQGTTDTAKLDEIVIFRQVDGVDMAALFSLKDIRGGRAPDPLVYANDKIVVGNNQTNPLIANLLALSPITGLFYQVVR